MFRHSDTYPTDIQTERSRSIARVSYVQTLFLEALSRARVHA